MLFPQVMKLLGSIIFYPSLFLFGGIDDISADIHDKAFDLYKKLYPNTLVVLTQPELHDQSQSLLFSYSDYISL